MLLFGTAPGNDRITAPVDDGATANSLTAGKGRLEKVVLGDVAANGELARRLTPERAGDALTYSRPGDGNATLAEGAGATDICLEMDIGEHDTCLDIGTGEADTCLHVGTGEGADNLTLGTDALDDNLGVR
mmetsp:Transcript_51548/g.81808  ORF Transcript_51548/g.81808 Transcript_51548/m.81808 type:complete len:131 (+) Transcript_51548:329-721(+)